MSWLVLPWAWLSYSPMNLLQLLPHSLAVDSVIFRAHGQKGHTAKTVGFEFKTYLQKEFFPQLDKPDLTR